MKRMLKNINPLSNKKQSVGIVENPLMNHFTKCTVCNFTPVNPHHMGCPHIFCYVCLKVESMMKLNRFCLIFDVCRAVRWQMKSMNVLYVVCPIRTVPARELMQFISKSHGSGKCVGN